MSPLEPLIHCHGVSKIYGNGTVALVNVDLTVEKGEFVFLVGASGAGKSTLVRLLMCEELPSEGRVYVEDRDLCELRRKEISHHRRRIGVIFQDFKLLANRTVYGNVAFALEVVGTARNRIQKRVPGVLRRVGLDHKADVFPGELSGGERQRVSVARAIINNPSLLIADEPTGNLDPDTATRLMELLDSINRRGTTVLMATHDRHIVDAMKKRVVVLEKGSIVRDDRQGVYAHAT